MYKIISYENHGTRQIRSERIFLPVHNRYSHHTPFPPSSAGPPHGTRSWEDHADARTWGCLRCRAKAEWVDMSVRRCAQFLCAHTGRRRALVRGWAGRADRPAQSPWCLCGRARWPRAPGVPGCPPAASQHTPPSAGRAHAVDCAVELVARWARGACACATVDGRCSVVGRGIGAADFSRRVRRAGDAPGQAQRQQRGLMRDWLCGRVFFTFCRLKQLRTRAFFSSVHRRSLLRTRVLLTLRLLHLSALFLLTAQW